MKRLLLLLALAAPALVRAQSAGQVVNGTSGGDDRYINIEECSGVGASGPIELLWNVTLDSGSLGAGVFRVYATNKAPAATAPRFCETADDPNASPPVFSKLVGEVEATIGRTTGSVDIATADIRAAAGYACGDETLADQTITVCVHYHPDDAQGVPGSATGWAVGSLVLSLRRPPAPVSVSAQGGEGSLNISWDEGTPTSTQTTPEEHRVFVTPPGGTSIVRDASGTSTVFTGLVNGTTYDVEVFGLSAARNPSLGSVATSGTPVPTEDFWEFYNGVEQGGCSAGAAGPVALLGLAGLLAVLRRRR